MMRSITNFRRSSNQRWFSGAAKINSSRSVLAISFIERLRTPACSDELVGALHLRHVATIVDDLQAGVRNLSMKLIAKTERDEFIFAAPENQRWLLERLKFVIERIIATNH